MKWLLLSIFFTLISALLNGFETAFVGINRIWLHNKLEKKSNRAMVLNFLLKHSENMLASFLVGINLADVAIVLCFLNYLKTLGFSDSLIPILNTITLTPTILIFATFIPKVISKEYPDHISFYLSYFFLAIYIILYPLQLIFTAFGKLLMKIFRIKRKKIFSREDFNIILNSYSSELLKETEKEFIQKVMAVKQIRAKEIMVPLVRMSCVEENEPVKVAIALMGATGLTRLPVFRMRVDNMVGYIEIKDLISVGRNSTISKYYKKGIYVSEFTTLNNILLQMKKEKTQMAFVVDEYGGVTGIITNQEIINELFGKFHEKKEEMLHKEKDYWIANGMLSIEELNEELNLNIEHVEFETLAGFLLYQLKRIPAPHEKIEVKNYVFEIFSTTPTRIKQVKIYKRSRDIFKWKKQ